MTWRRYEDDENVFYRMELLGGWAAEIWQYDKRGPWFPCVWNAHSYDADVLIGYEDPQEAAWAALDEVEKRVSARRWSDQDVIRVLYTTTGMLP